MNSSLTRCAIYTRVSGDDKVYSSFNALDAQREACAAFIASRKGEGWVAADSVYCDGGFSGGTLDRPSLDRLLVDVRRGLVNTIVVYKIDRLTRSIRDFAKIISILEEHGASFCAVTQSFNTTDSMGRLTLNILLSFAQFERELASERILDKRAASFANGIWIGSRPALGYRYENQQLIVVPEEAKQASFIFNLYLQTDTLRSLVDKITAAGLRTKLATHRDGTTRGGRVYDVSGVRNMLLNPIFVGKIRSRGRVTDGRHEAIIDPALFEKVQKKLAISESAKHHRVRRFLPNLLDDIAKDAHGNILRSVRYAKANGTTLRYYLTTKASSRELPRIPANEFEQSVVSELDEWLGNHASLAEGVHPDELTKRLKAADDLRNRLRTEIVRDLTVTVRKIVAQVRLLNHALEIDVRTGWLDQGFDTGASHTIRVPIAVIKSGRNVRLIAPAGTVRVPRRDPKIIDYVMRTYRARCMLFEGRSMAEISSAFGVSECQGSRLVQAGLHSPRVIQQLLQGSQPYAFFPRIIQETSAMPMSWAAQEAKFGLAPRQEGPVDAGSPSP